MLSHYSPPSDKCDVSDIRRIWTWQRGAFTHLRSIRQEQLQMNLQPFGLRIISRFSSLISRQCFSAPLMPRPTSPLPATSSPFGQPTYLRPYLRYLFVGLRPTHLYLRSGLRYVCPPSGEPTFCRIKSSNSLVVHQGLRPFFTGICRFASRFLFITGPSGQHFTLRVKGTGLRPGHN